LNRRAASGFGDGNVNSNQLIRQRVTPPDLDLDYDDTEVNEESVEKALLLYSVNKLD